MLEVSCGLYEQREPWNLAKASLDEAILIHHRNRRSCHGNCLVLAFVLLTVTSMCSAFTSSHAGGQRGVFTELQRSTAGSALCLVCKEKQASVPLTDDLVMTTDDSEDDAMDEECPSDDTSAEYDDDAAPAEDEDAAEERRSVAAARAALLAKRSGKGPSTRHGPKNTSVGARRIGSATQARQGGRATSKLMDAVRKTAAGAAATAETERKNDDFSAKMIRVTNSLIHAAIEDILSKSSTAKLDLSSPFGLFGRSINDGEAPKSILHPGAVILSPESPTDTVTVRVATQRDDIDIASLRLSVFSEFAADMHDQFRARSCQALHNRRLRGAMCLVATTPRKANGAWNDPGMVLGSAECSFHEFLGTRLGRRRLQNSILYLTEVAVNPGARRQGIGRKLLLAMDQVAMARGAETLYLHVDVTNDAALALYDLVGYRKVDLEDPMFMEFTTTLNLHPGATKGRDHFLLYKDLHEPTWLHEEATETREDALIGTLGFEIPP